MVDYGRLVLDLIEYYKRSGCGGDRADVSREEHTDIEFSFVNREFLLRLRRGARECRRSSAPPACVATAHELQRAIDEVARGGGGAVVVREPIVLSSGMTIRGCTREQR